MECRKRKRCYSFPRGSQPSFYSKLNRFKMSQILICDNEYALYLSRQQIIINTINKIVKPEGRRLLEMVLYFDFGYLLAQMLYLFMILYLYACFCNNSLQKSQILSKLIQQQHLAFLEIFVFEKIRVFALNSYEVMHFKLPYKGTISIMAKELRQNVFLKFFYIFNSDKSIFMPRNNIAILRGLINIFITSRTVYRFITKGAILPSQPQSI